MPTRQAKPQAARPSAAGSTNPRSRISASKLSVPPVRPGIVDRPLLLDGLMSTTHVPLVLVSAPPGYGKTTALALWNQRDERNFAWVTLDVTDNDPVALVASVIAALDPVLHLDAAIGGALNAPVSALEDFVVPALLDACIQTTRPFVLVLDDVHLVTEKRCHAVIDYLVERLPTGSQLALGTRTDPPLPLGALRAHGRLMELRAAELSLDNAEAQALLGAAGVALTDDLVARLVERTEGWPAAIYLAALSLRDRSGPEDFVDRFTGGSRHVADFLSEDVLARQPDAVISFLLNTCILETLNPSLCDALTDTADSADALERLEHSNLFVVPLDEERRAYRYHHLFAQYLRAELARREPNLVPELHRRAWQWYRDHGLAERAIAHARACRDFDAAAEMVAAEWSAAVQSGQIETVRTWLASFEDPYVEGHAPLAIAAAWVAALTGEPERAARFAEAARRGHWDGPMPDGTVSLESAVAIMSSAFGFDSVSRMQSVAQRAVDLERAPSWHRATALVILGIALTLEGDFRSARHVLVEAVRLAGETSTGALSMAHLALISVLERDENSAFRHAQRAHALVEQPRMRNDLAAVGTYSVVALVLSGRGDLERAAVAVERIIAQADRGLLVAHDRGADLACARSGSAGPPR
jgi:LuxR family maltose regulon positive regulatory protein